MAEDSELDLSTFPTEVNFPTTLESPAGDGGDMAVVMIPFQFCLLFAGRPWLTLTVAAPSPGNAAATMHQFVREVVNPTLMSMGYPANICSSSPGPCPA